MHSETLYWLLFVAIFGSAGFAIWKGDTAARLAATLGLVDLLGMQLLALIMPGKETVEVVRLAADGLWAVGLLLLALRYARLWMGALVLVQSIQFSLHAYYLVNEQRLDFTYVVVNNVDNWIASFCLIAGTILAWRRRVAVAREDARLETSKSATDERIA
jgi:hypothetical protein